MATATEYFGIDLGTTYSSVCFCQKPDSPAFLTDKNRVNIPSAVSFSDDGGDFLFGEDAEKHPEHLLCETKRLLGMHFDSPEVQELIKNKHFDGFTLVPDEGGRVKIEFEKGGEKVSMYPWEVTAMFLKHLHGLICQRFNYDAATKIKAVISVPAYFSHFQRAETMRAGAKAGFEVVEVVNEPTAAAIARLSGTPTPNKRVLVVDFGGGKLDVTVMDTGRQQNQPSYTVVATHGNTCLGGVDFDHTAADELLEQYRKKYPKAYAMNYDPTGKTGKELEAVRRRLYVARKLAQAAKERFLAKKKDAKVPVRQLDDTFEGDDDVTVSYDAFAERAKPLFDRCMDCVREALDVREVDKASIDQVLMVGGSSNLQEIVDRVSDFVDGKEVVRPSAEDEQAVANGALLMAYKIGADPKQFAVQEVCPVSLGLCCFSEKTRTEYIAHLIKASDPIPKVVTITAHTVDDNQETAENKIYQGNETTPLTRNYIIGYRINNLPRRKAGEVEINFTMSYDKNGLVKVSSEVVNPVGVRMTGKPGCSFSIVDEKVSKNGQQSISVSCADYP